MEKEQNKQFEEKESKSPNIEDKQNNDQTKPEDKLKNLEDKQNNDQTKPEDKLKNLEDKLARTLAEMENQRRRFEKEKDEAFEYGGFSFARESLNLIDNLERVKQSLESDEKIKGSDALKKTLEHLDIVKKDLISIFKKNNIDEIAAVNKKLDPNLHQAMMEIEDSNKEPGIIIQEIQKGYIMKDRLLRPSLVAVSKKPEKNGEKSEEKSNK